MPLYEEQRHDLEVSIKALAFGPSVLEFDSQVDRNHCTIIMVKRYENLCMSIANGIIERTWCMSLYK
jgi:hypothetical protein